ncbi:MAG: hypothetical protein APF76_12415 [Desulfitibacter sp. BRH_c19]|nr:MAG: hypothetical protein APF76_12415 [Desulfitibacter sp. BRH_c19]
MLSIIKPNIPGLEKGAVIKRIDGMDIELYIKEMPPWLRSGSTARQQRYRAFTHLLTVTLEEEKVVTLKALDGEIYEIVLNEELIHIINPETAKRDAVSQYTHNIKGERLSSGIGLIEIPTFQGDRSKMIKELDDALGNLLDAPGIIIDLRGNGGGSTFIAHPIAGRFFAEPFIYGVEYYKNRLPLRGWAKEYEFGVRPRGDTYEGAIAVLVDTSNMSTAENFIAAMKDSGRATIIGRPTAGSSGNPVT